MLNLMHQSHHKNFREQVKKVTYDEICLRCALPAETLSEMIEYGVIEPLFSSNKEEPIYFSSSSLMRVNTAIRLCRDLEVNIAGAALAIELLDEIKLLRKNLNNLQN
ncbi:chaperone modulator CbpM [Methylophaga pinxianii]|uniref:chaperone modulator CbpM n=2 Tax=Methylophaga pinxianii TaxID=2881052 RepID=UPI00299D3F48|nr:chaperone modulator CbpM [Methylophaga pinxianii]